jgi:hypothetical protein
LIAPGSQYLLRCAANAIRGRLELADGIVRKTLQLLAEFLAGVPRRVHHLIAGTRELLVRRPDACFDPVAQRGAGFGDSGLRTVDYVWRRCDADR